MKIAIQGTQALLLPTMRDALRPTEGPEDQAFIPAPHLEPLLSISRIVEA